MKGTEMKDKLEEIKKEFYKKWETDSHGIGDFSGVSVGDIPLRDREKVWNFFEPILTQVERDKEEETAKDIALMCRVLLTKKDGDFIANEIERIYLTSSKKEQNE